MILKKNIFLNNHHEIAYVIYVDYDKFLEGNTDGMKQIKKNWHVFLASKSISNKYFFIIINRLTDKQKITDESFIDEAFLSII